MSEYEKIKKEIMLTLEIKTCQTQIEQAKKNMWKIIIMKEKSVESFN